MSDEPQAQQPEFIDLVADIVSAYVSKNNVPVAELAGLIASVHASLSGLGQPAAAPAEDHKITPAQIRKSVTPDGPVANPQRLPRVDHAARMVPPVPEATP